MTPKHTKVKLIRKCASTSLNAKTNMNKPQNMYNKDSLIFATNTTAALVGHLR